MRSPTGVILPLFFFFFLCENIAPRSLSLLSSLGPALTSPLLPQNVQPVILHPIIERYCYVIRGLKGDVTQDDSQRRFLAQQSVAMLEQCCNYSKQCHNNVATLCCAKNRRSNRPVKHHLKQHRQQRERQKSDRFRLAK